MATLAWIFALIYLLGQIWVVVLCFQEGETLWGIGSIFIPFVAAIYAILNLAEAKIPLVLMAVGSVGQIVLGVMGASTA